METKLRSLGTLLSAIALGWLCTSAGSCASGELGSCANEDDCETGEICVDGSCELDDTMFPDTTGSDTEGPPVGDGSSSDSEGNGSGDSGGGGEDDADGGSDDVGPSDCRGDGDCGLGKTCSEGTCVSQCQPECGSGEQCADRGEGFECFSTCDEASSTEGCSASGTRCRDVFPSDENREILICDESQCSSDSDCSIGTCVQFVNDFGQCVQNGTESAGQPCNGVGECEEGVICLGASNTSSGTCRRLCDPWNGNCPEDEKCALFREDSGPNGTLDPITLRQGWCKPETTTRGGNTLARCEPVDAMCDHGIRCLSFASNNLCTKWCRPGQGDCAGEIPPSIGSSGACNNFVFGGIREVGQCRPACDTDSDCGEEFVCVDRLCRQSCSTDSDCCDTSPCNFSCGSNGLCE